MWEQVKEGEWSGVIVERGGERCWEHPGVGTQDVGLMKRLVFSAGGTELEVGGCAVSIGLICICSCSIMHPEYI